ncbi:penicillin-binding protein 1B [Aquimonas sp.]|uniref:penicillin-binding protein 1B n=1 Tax=Aquimonas sp. TaxID=1872588 RepID=UPI0037C10976
MSSQKTTRQLETPAPERSWGTLIWAIAKTALLLGAGLATGFLAPYFWVIDQRVAADFAALSWQVPTRVMARPLLLKSGVAMDLAGLRAELDAAGYRDDGQGREPGSYGINGQRVQLSTRAFIDVDGAQPPLSARVQLAGGQISALTDLSGKALAELRVDPARIATLYGEKREERRLVRLEDVPPLVVMTLQAVEDRDFKHHIGIDFSGVARAAWMNLRSGEMRQGASTLTQQLARNLYLTRERKLWRKVKEALHALAIERRFEKSQILEAYLNEIFLGQQGGQAIHGVAAAAEFWFGSELAQLKPNQIALLIGIIRGPSYYDPRRHPERALERRNRVLNQMAETGLIEVSDAEREAAKPLGLKRNVSLAGNRAPAFMALVRTQLERDYPADALRGAGLTVHTTLSPLAQAEAERAAREQLDALQTDARPELQAAVVVTDAAHGEVLALLGDRAADGAGFNRALDAQRPVGSMLKPFVYLLALAQPGRFALASPIDDTPIELRLPNGQAWAPSNSDNVSHGSVTLQAALANSYNQATVRLGMQLGVDRLAQLIEALSGTRPQPHPSLLLGAVDMSPFQIAQLYQFVASGGRLQPLRAVRGVLDASGEPLTRYDRPTDPAQPGDALAARLIGIALQDAARTGTGKRLYADGLGHLQPAGKTGTSNDGRDSWFAGYTGAHLAVVWVGNDGNAATGLYGASGAMRVWTALFKRLPSSVLNVGTDGLEFAWLDADNFARTDEACPDARRFAFIAGYTPEDYEGCPLTRVRGWFGRGDSAQ